MSELLTADQIRTLLEDRILHTVARRAGLNPHTLYRLRDGKHEPTEDTRAKLTAYFRGSESLAQKC